MGASRPTLAYLTRTRSMHEVAEMGVAAHWAYKQGMERIDGRQYRWLRELLDILEHASGPEEFLFELEKVAVVDGASAAETTYGALRDQVDAIAGALAARGVRVGDVVALQR